jgi:hypothetical protein
MLINVFAVDPGTTTGWCFARGVDPDTTPHTECDWDIASGQMAGEEYQQAYDLWRLIKRVGDCAVIIEDFIPQQLNKERWFLSPVRITSQLTMLLWIDKRVWMLQAPSLAKSTISDDYMRAIGLWSPGEPHANDAVRHALLFTRRVGRHHMLYGQATRPRGLDTMSP